MGCDMKALARHRKPLDQSDLNTETTTARLQAKNRSSVRVRRQCLKNMSYMISEFAHFHKFFRIRTFFRVEKSFLNSHFLYCIIRLFPSHDFRCLISFKIVHRAPVCQLAFQVVTYRYCPKVIASAFHKSG